MHLSRRHKFWSVSAYDQQFFKIQGHRKLEMYRMAHTELEYLTVKKSILYKLKTYPLGPQICGRYVLRIAVSEIQGCQKSKMQRMTPNWIPTFNIQKNTLKTYARGQNFGPFHCTTIRFQCIQGFWKLQISGMYRMTSNLLWSLHSQKYLIYTK